MKRPLPALLVLPLLLCACHSSEPPAQQALPDTDGVAAAATPDLAERHEPLPRSVAGVSLDTTRADAEAKLGHLACHENKTGFEVCDTKKGEPNIHHLQLYLSHDHVIALSYEPPLPANAWDALNKLIDRYGHPSLSGVRERDKQGRLHEIYGWKDDQSLYSLRLMWKDNEAGERKLIGTAVTLWDRKGYHNWEAEIEKKQPPTPPPETGTSQEPV